MPSARFSFAVGKETSLEIFATRGAYTRSAHLLAIFGLFGGGSSALRNQHRNAVDHGITPPASDANNRRRGELKSRKTDRAGEILSPELQIRRQRIPRVVHHRLWLVDQRIWRVFARMIRTPRRTAQKLLLDTIVGSGMGELVGDADAVEDGAII